MIRFFKLFICIFALFISDANAYEFKKINHLFDSVKIEAISKPNFRVMSLESLNILNQIDKDIRVFHNKNRAFLYKKNNLIMSFDLPKESDCLAWKELLNGVLEVSLQRSNLLLTNKDEIETEILNICARNIDKYSRLEKEKIDARNNYFEYSIEDNILYVRFTSFFDGFAAFLEDIIENNKSIDGLILDLRQNRGGNFNEALKVSDLFLDNALITYTTRQGSSKKYYTSTDGDILKGKRIIILTSEHTASSAEIVTAALSEQGRAITIGTQTYGKGSIQKVYHLKNITFYLTNALIYSPSGKPIEDNGVKPQICSGVENSCTISDENNPNKDILLAINLIKNNLG